MLKILGRKRVIMLSVLAFLSAVIVVLWLQFLTPAREMADNKYNSVKSALETKRADITKLKKEYVLLQNQVNQFKDIEAIGFFNDQNRVLAQETFEKFRETSGVLKANYTVSAGEEVKDERADSVNHTVLKSPINIEIESIDDTDFLNFIKLVLEQFPGRSNLESLQLNKSVELTQTSIKDIGAGKPVALIKGSVKYNWLSMMKKESETPASPADPAVPADPAATAAVMPGTPPAPQSMGGTP